MPDEQQGVSKSATLALEAVGLSFGGHAAGAAGHGDGEVLREIDFDLLPGQFTSLVGPSGCGKTSILRLFAGLQRPTSGSLRVAGRPTIACVFQEPNLLPWRSVSGNIRLPLELSGRPRVEQDRDVLDAVELIGLRTSDTRKFPRMLSGGMRMRVSLARALVTRPDVLLLDEPFAALDDMLRQQLNEELLRIWGEQSWSGLFVTHNVSEAVFLSQRVVVMSSHPGRIEHVIDVPYAYPRLPSLRGASFIRTARSRYWSTSAGAGCMMRWLGNTLLPPLLLLAILLLSWQVAVVTLDIPAYLLPTPVGVWSAAWGRSSEMIVATGLTGAGALCGFAASLVLGTIVALVFSQSPVVRNSCYPYAIFLQTVPIVAIAPLIVTWLGTGFRSVVVIACIISLFPIITNVTTGLISVDPGLHDLFRIYRASRWQVLWKLQIPNAIPYLVTGARVSSGLAVVGAIVGEFFVGYGAQRHGLGYTILYAGPQLKTDQLFAATIASALLGVAMFAGCSLVGKMVLGRWYEKSLN